MFHLAPNAVFWKPKVMTMKWESLGLNTKFEITHLFKGSRQFIKK
jgi:hypothetical protein